MTFFWVLLGIVVVSLAVIAVIVWLDRKSVPYCGDPVIYQCLKMVSQVTCVGGEPTPQPGLTDADAKARKWVMVRDDESETWYGPERLAMVRERKRFRYLVESGGTWNQAREATEGEIARAKK